jgi:hypothetical protein
LKNRFKRIIVDGVEISLERIEEYSQLEWEAYSAGMELDPETLKIIPIQEQTKQWESGDREPIDYQGRE